MEKRILTTEEKFYYNKRIVEYKSLTKEDKRKAKNIFKHIVEKIKTKDFGEKGIKIDLNEEDMAMLKDYIKITIGVEDYTPSNNKIRDAYVSAKATQQVSTNTKYCREDGVAYNQQRFLIALQSAYKQSTNLTELRRQKALAE